MGKNKLIQRITAMMLSIIMIVGIIPVSVFSHHGGATVLPTGREAMETVQGLGTEEEPLRIETAAQLAAFAWSVNHGLLPDILPEHPYLILVNDIDLSDYDEEDYYGKGWMPIGGYYNENVDTYAFNGTFDGNDKTISGLYIDRDERYVGLFGYIKEGTVKNLTIEDGNVTGYASTGGIVGDLYNGRIENCVFSGSVTGEEDTGGIVGSLNGSQVEGCLNTGIISGDIATGGIVGGAGSDDVNDHIRNCMNDGDITGNNVFTGGIVGFLGGMLVDYSVNTGTVQGVTGINTGGVSGNVFEGIIQNCVNNGDVFGNANNVGGVTGLINVGIIQNCVNYADISSDANSVGGVTGFVEGNSLIKNCLTTGNISGKVTEIEPGGISGVAGCLKDKEENNISDCIALGQSVTNAGEMGNVARISSIYQNYIMQNNFAWKEMELWYDGELIPEEEYSLGDGEDADAATLQTLWTDGALAENWKAAGVWTLAEGKLPVLTGLPDQRDQFPSHIPVSITDVTVSPNFISVQKGTTQTFTATVSGIGAFDDTVTWSLRGATHVGTAMDPFGVLTVDGDETTDTLTVTATSNGDDSKNGTAHVIVTDAPLIKYSLIVNRGSGTGEYVEGAKVTLAANVPEKNKLFHKWVVTSGTLNLDDATANPITITMPGEGINIEAIYKDKPADSDPSYPATTNDHEDSLNIIIIPPASDRPNTPTQGEIRMEDKVDNNGNLGISIKKRAVTDAFEKALTGAKKNGNESNGISLVLKVNIGHKTVNSVDFSLPKVVQEYIIGKKIVNIVIVVDPGITISIDLTALKEINRQAGTDVNIKAAPIDNSKLSSNAKTAIGSRPVFDFKIIYGNDKQIQNFGAGSVVVAIPYNLGAKEKSGNVQGIYVDEKGKMQWLINSVYDSVNKVLRFSTNHFSIYGVGYKQDTPTFTDIHNHWAKDDIDFVVARELFDGTSLTTFSPNTPMTRGMFVTALGRLANADVSSYKQSNFTDVKNDAYYTGYIAWANKNKIVTGIGDGRFAPDESITREQMAAIMSNYANTIGFIFPKIHTENSFTDNAKISTYAKAAVIQMQMASVISGKKGNIFDPQGTVLRAEVAAVLHRFVALAISHDPIQSWAIY